MTTGAEVVTLANGFTVAGGTPALVSVNPSSGQQGQQNLSVALTGQFTNWVQGTTLANFGSGITVVSLTVGSPTTATAVLNIGTGATAGAHAVTLTTGSEIETATNVFTVTVAGIQGKVFAPDNTTPEGNVLVRLFGPTFQQTTTASDGSFVFQSIPVGTYSLDSIDSNGVLRARQPSVTVSSSAQAEIQDLTWLGVGDVTGEASNPSGTGASGVDAAVFSANSEVGGFFDATTDGSGGFDFSGVPVGKFRVLVSDPAQQWVGNTAGQIARDQDSQTANVQLEPADWIQLQPTGPLPSVRSGNTAVYDPTTNRMIIFSGGTTVFPLDTWVLTNANGLGGSPAWIQLSPAGTPPPSLYGQAAVYDQVNNRMVVFGGTGNGEAFNGVWVLTNANGLGGTPQWTQLSPSGALPPPRRFLGAAYDSADNRMIIFGGEDGGQVYNDVWVLTNANGLGGTPTWIQLNPTGGPPAARSGFASGYDPSNNRLIIFGGLSADNDTAPQYNDVWVLTDANGLGGAPQWIQLIPNGAFGSPSPRRSIGTYDPASNRLTIFGIIAACPVEDDCAFLTDTWVLEGANGVGSAPAWTQLSPSGGAPPPAGSAVYDPSSNRLISFGGTVSNGSNFLPKFNDTWVLTNANGAGITATNIFGDDFNRPNGFVGYGWLTWQGSLLNSSAISLSNDELSTQGSPNQGGGVYRAFPVTFPLAFSFDFHTQTPTDEGWLISFNAPASSLPPLSGSATGPAQVLFYQNAGSRNINRGYLTANGIVFDSAPGLAEPVPGYRNFSANATARVEGIINADLSATITIHYNDGLTPDPVVVSFPAASTPVPSPPGSILILGNSNASAGPDFFDNFKIAILPP